MHKNTNLRFTGFLILLLFVHHFASAQSWKVMTPFNSYNTYRDMESTPNGKLHILAEGPRAYGTLDGVAWSSIGVSGLGNPLDMTMFDDTKGFMITSSGNLSKTTDDWQTASNVNYGENLPFKNLFFVNENVGFISGYVRQIKKTTDGGQTWSYASVPSTIMPSGEVITDMHFVSEQIGFVITDHGKVIKTTDQGATWTLTQLQQSTYELDKLLFINDQIGFAVGSLGEVYRTADQGATWTLNDTDMGIIYDIRLHNGILYMVGSSRTFTRSTDLGLTWEPVQTINVSGASSVYRLYAVGFLGDNILAAGENGYIFKANNAAGTSWSAFYTPIAGNVDVRDLQFTNSNQGVMLGAGVSQSAMCYTADGGKTWQSNVSSNPYGYRSIDMKPNGRGLLVTPGGYSITTNGGQSWTGMGPIQPATAYTKCWLKANNDIFVGTNPGTSQTDGMIRRSGTTWSQFMDMYQIGDIKFADENVGYACTGNYNFVPKFWKTVDGGATWTAMSNYIGGTVIEIQAITADKVYVLGSNGLVVTLDGGVTWNDVENFFPTRFHFFDALNGYGMYPDYNAVYKTEDGGETWEMIISNATSFCGNDTSVFFQDKVVTASGKFLVCVLDIAPELQLKLNNPGQKNKIVVYPNPSKTSWNISEAAASVRVADISGKVVATYQYVNKVDVSGYENGIYFLTITLENGAKETIKVVKN